MLSTPLTEIYVPALGAQGVADWCTYYHGETNTSVTHITVRCEQLVPFFRYAQLRDLVFPSLRSRRCRLSNAVAPLWADAGSALRAVLILVFKMHGKTAIVWTRYRTSNAWCGSLVSGRNR